MKKCPGGRSGEVLPDVAQGQWVGVLQLVKLSTAAVRHVVRWRHKPVAAAAAAINKHNTRWRTSAWRRVVVMDWNGPAKNTQSHAALCGRARDDGKGTGRQWTAAAALWQAIRVTDGSTTTLKRAWRVSSDRVFGGGRGGGSRPGRQRHRSDTFVLWQNHRLSRMYYVICDDSARRTRDANTGTDLPRCTGGRRSCSATSGPPPSSAN